MTVAICLECGEFKFGAFNSCKECGARPHDVDELALSLACSDHYFDKPTLEQISKIIQAGEEPLIQPELLQWIRAELSSPENEDLLKGLEARWR
jgi:hypothetical protein